MDYELHYIGIRLDLSKSGDAVVMRRWGVCERPAYQNEVDYTFYCLRSRMTILRAEGYDMYA